MYNPADVISGHNKLLGINQLTLKGLGVHENSIRIGWISTGDSILVGLYSYVKGERTITDICSTLPGQENYAEIEIGGGMYRISVNGNFKTIPQPFSGGFKFKLFPYFGGQSTAPEQMTIYIREL